MRPANGVSDAVARRRTARPHPGLGGGPAASDARTARSCARGRHRECRAGRHGDLPAPSPSPSPSPERHPWAVAVGFGGGARFVDPGGETARAALRSPFAGNVGESFWAHHESPGGWWDGNVDDPGDARHIAAMRFGRCRLLPRGDLPPPGSYETLTLEAEILEVLGADDLLALTPSDRAVDDVLDGLRYDPQAGTGGRLRIVTSKRASARARRSAE